MKRILLAAATLLLAVAMKAQTGADAIIKVNTENHDFGKILNGKPVDYYFEITNKSDKPVVVENAWGSCGCTTPEKPTEPIAPGATAKLKVSYNAAAMGTFSKQVFIKLVGVDNPKTVTISGETLSQEAYDAYVKEQADKSKNAATTTNSSTQQPTKTKAKTSKTKSKSGK
ncbi:MAG TPA: DUF1573 domain-containing protein [Chitinophagaceae bacterium]|jgi:hypothetical protein|nr:DUF1573 domain-containing protein [Chitinophagaceae bacterium]